MTGQHINAGARAAVAAIAALGVLSAPATARVFARSHTAPAREVRQAKALLWAAAEEPLRWGAQEPRTRAP